VFAAQSNKDVFAAQSNKDVFAAQSNKDVFAARSNCIYLCIFVNRAIKLFVDGREARFFIGLEKGGAR